ncbi:MAG: hypothetical protein CR991_09680 [Proteobacteria bacterium]|nr:MAG: hypothetical protein CR991_09680 [Pseudomonadota bacterium]
MRMKTYQHLHTSIDEQRIFWLAVNVRNKTLNLLTLELLDELEQVYQQIIATEPTGLVVYSSKPYHFMAGIDLALLQKLNQNKQTVAFIQRAQQLFQKFKALTIPSVVLITGNCLAAGLEFALSFQYRIAADSPETVLGFTETKLGLHPTLYGLNQAIQLGGINALKMALTGDISSPTTALRHGLVNALSPLDRLKTAARHYIQQQPAHAKPALSAKLLNLDLVRTVFAIHFRQRLRSRQWTELTHPGSYSLLQLWQKEGQHPDAAKAAEAIQTLIQTDSTQNLIRLFLKRKQLRQLSDKSLFQAHHVHIIGAGVIGCEIAHYCAQHNIKVSLQDKQAKVLEQFVNHLQQLPDTPAHRLLKANIHIQTEPQDALLRQADLIIEAIPDKLADKQELFAHLEEQAKPTCLLLSATSCLPLEKIAAVMLNPQRLVGMHFFYPLQHSELLEIGHIPGTTHPQILQQAYAFAAQIKKVALPVENSPGYIVNRILFAYILQGIHLHQQQVPHTVLDKAARDFGIPLGPLELADAIGLDYCRQVGELLTKTSQLQLPELLINTLNSGKFGKKSGSGFYRYRNGRMLKPERAVWEGSIAALQEKLVGQMAEEAALCLEQGIVEEADLLDAAVVLATGFAPFRGGPLHFTRSLKK